MSEVKLTLLSSEGEKFPTDARIKDLSVLIHNITEDSTVHEAIPLVSVPSRILTKVLSYCEHHQYAATGGVKKPVPTDRIEDAVEDQWDADFMNEFDEETLIDVTLASNYMDMKCLLELCCAKIATLFKGKTIDELRHKYGITEEFTSEEEERLKKEYPWAVEGAEERLMESRSKD